jgi:REP element-mobilizing transposase RayT
VCKYRKRLLTGRNIIGDVKRLSLEYVARHNTTIHYMEVDKDHIHYMIETTPNINLSRLIRNMKSHIIFGKNIQIIFPSAFGKKRLSFPMDISSVLSEM